MPPAQPEVNRGADQGEQLILSAPWETTKQTVTPFIQTFCFGKNMTFCLIKKLLSTYEKWEKETMDLDTSF